MDREKSPSILSVNILYLILAIILITAGALAQKQNIYIGILITEYILVLLPNIWFIKSKGLSLKNVLRLNKISIKESITIILITILSYPVIVFLQAIFIAILSIFREIDPTTAIPLPTDGLSFILGFLVIGVSPGICEEIMFRGTIMKAYERLGYKKSIIMSAILFGMFHFTLLNFIGPTILGIIFGILVHKTNSIYGSIIGHTVNNTMALSIGYLVGKYESTIDDILQGGSTEVAGPSLIGVLLGIMIIGLCAYTVIILIRSLSSEKENNQMEMTELIISIDKTRTTHLLEYIPIFLVIILFIVLNFNFVL